MVARGGRAAEASRRARDISAAVRIRLWALILGMLIVSNGAKKKVQIALLSIVARQWCLAEE
jgi:hypothetical protein